MRNLIQLVLLFVVYFGHASAFAPVLHHKNYYYGRLYQHATLHAAAEKASIPNPFKKLPWNVRKEKEREARRLKQERAQLHRQLGIPEDATYEEIVAATDLLIVKAGPNLKEKVKIETAKDKILQIRLNERLAGLAQVSKDARAQSSFEVEGIDEDDNVPKAAKEWNAPAWMQGLVVKPDTKRIQSQLKLWGAITAVGLTFPPSLEYLTRFTWLVCVSQLINRGMPESELERGGMGLSTGFFGGGGGKTGHRKVSFLIGISTWLLGTVLINSLMPTWARAQRWTSLLAFCLQNLIYLLVSCYLQPYKG